MGVVLFSLLLCPAYSQHPPHSSTCSQDGKIQCPMQSPFKFAEIESDNQFTYITTTCCPPYDNPGWTNPSQACQFPVTYRIPLQPKVAKIPLPLGEKLSVYENITYLKEDPKPILGVIGVLMNGVNIFGVGSPCGYSSKCPQQGGPSQWVDAVESEGHTVDSCGGHAAPSHQYHIHSGVGMVTSEGRRKCQLPVDVVGEHSELLGWLFDGFGLYGRYSLNGTIPTDLDSCGGHTHVIRGVDTYHYHMPDGFPWTIGCYKGCPEVSNNPHELRFSEDEKYGC